MAISIIEIDGTSYQLGASASNVAFDSTGTGIEAGTVQDAIEAIASAGGGSQDSGDADTQAVINACDEILT